MHAILTGADVLVDGLHAAGVDVCFANPGTSEVHLVRGLDSARSIRACLALHENVVTGAADGYARMSGRPAAALLHLGPGLANGIANLHNARRARTPIVALVGQHETWHRAAGSPLASDIEALASTVSVWVRESTSSSDLGQDACDAVSASLGSPRGVATLILPTDVQRASVDSRRHTHIVRSVTRDPVDDTVTRAADMLRKGTATVLGIGGAALTEAALRVAARLAAATGCRVVVESHSARVEVGGGLPSFPTIPYYPEQAVDCLQGVTGYVLVGMRRPVYMFGAADGSSSPVQDADDVIEIDDTDALQALDSLASALGPLPEPASTQLTVARHTGPLDRNNCGATVARMLPADSILVDESGTSGTGYMVSAAAAARHTRLGVTGGAIGMGLPVAVGAAVACPARRVVALEADGSGMYTVQALWTMARESLDITIVMLVNHEYAILRTEFSRAGVDPLGPLAATLIDLSGPQIDWVRLAEAQGVPATRVTTVEELETAFARSLAANGPQLIEAII